jgi:Protein of unknown function (DUF3097)
MAVLGPGPDFDRPRGSSQPAPPIVRAPIGTRVVHRGTRFLGKVREYRDGGVELEGVTGDLRLFRLSNGSFMIDQQVVTLAPVIAVELPGPAPTTASGSIGVGQLKAKVAQANRIWVEGIHDAELIEKVWGDDLRVEGIVVESLDGIDHLEDLVAAFRPGPGRRLGVLVDHLVPGSKESRIATVVNGHYPDSVRVLGTPYVDVWQAVRPEAIGIAAWPVVPRSESWKEGICRSLGVSEPWMMWKKILGSVRSYADIESSLVGSVEDLIDFLTAEPSLD